MRTRILMILILLVICRPGSADIRVSVDRSSIMIDESFELIFESDEKIDTQPDFSVLNESFTIINKRQENAINISNGNIIQRQKWVLTVLADKTGSLTIPAVQFGNLRSRPVRIEILPKSPVGNSQRIDGIFIDVAVDNANPYVQEQIIYTARLFVAVQIANASLSEPAVDHNVIINKIGDDKNYEKHHNGRRYKVIERRYAIFPQSSGRLKIKPLVLKGQTGSGGFFNFNPFGPQPDPIVRRSDEIVLDVKPIPQSFQGKTWLPATQLSLQEQWSADPTTTLKQGEAATRTLILRANGLTASQLPAIDAKLPDSLKTYPDQAEFEDLQDNAGTVGVRRDKMAIVPTRAGELVLPSIRLPWWNVKTDSMETAELPERRIHVAAGATNQPPNASVGVNNDSLSEHGVTTRPAEGAGRVASYWQWASMGLFVLWGATLFLWWRTRRNTNNKQGIKEEPAGKRIYLRRLRRACYDNDAEAAKNALLLWARVNWPEKSINSLEAIGDCCDDDFRDKLRLLSQKLYADASSPWDGQTFLQSFKAQSFQPGQPPPATGKLEPLYKSG